ncbi:hypothetical protein NKJ59_31760 [Mesorhizobium australicum]|uniref:hypothetical protein n=1 Tax=Mesorhizobium australicum TaxID=536018 RepID=UPI00333756CF
MNLSAIAEQDERVQTGVNRGYDRLHPARLGHVELERLKRDLGSLTFSAQYQQSPAPPDGNMVKRVWFRDYDPHQFDRRSMNAHEVAVALLNDVADVDADAELDTTIKRFAAICRRGRAGGGRLDRGANQRWN